MDPLVIVHVATAVALVATSIVVGVWGLARAKAIANADDESAEARWFAHVLQLSHTLVLATCLLGLWLLSEGTHHADDPLHVRVYGTFMVVAIVAAYGYRTPEARRNVRVFAIAALVIAALGLRAIATG